MIGISEGRERVCKDSQGGIDRLWVFPYQDYPRRLIRTEDNVLVQFPATTIYQFDAFGEVTPVQKQQENDGGKYYDQAITFQIPGLVDTPQLEKLMRKDYRIIFRDRNGRMRLMGAYNGLTADRIQFETGGAKNSFYGATLDFTGKELREALFINDLAGAGFVTQDGWLLWQDYQPIYLQDNEILISQ